MNHNARILRLRIDEAATALRAANHATFRETVAIPDAYDLVGNLDELVHRLPQLFGFLGRAVERSPARIVDDRGRDPSEAIWDAARALDAATGGIDVVGVHLSTAHNALGHLGLDLRED